MIHTYRYSAQQLGNTVRDLLSSENTKRQYLTEAIETHFSKLSEEQFPNDLVDQYRNIRDRLRIPISIENQSLGSIIKSMDDLEIDELIGDILELSGRIDSTIRKLARSGPGFF